MSHTFEQFPKQGYGKTLFEDNSTNKDDEETYFKNKSPNMDD